MASDRTAKIKTDFFIKTPDEEYSIQFLEQGRSAGRDYAPPVDFLDSLLVTFNQPIFLFGDP
jgi:hypothetical protein